MDKKQPKLHNVFGKMINPLNPSPDDFDIEVIAHSLSLKCRFNGHIKWFYSVAQHAYLVSMLVSDENALWGLLHEMDEVYFPDIPAPLKKYFCDWEKITNSNLEIGALKHGLRMPIPKEVKKFDYLVRCAEMRDLMADCEEPWLPNPKEYAMIDKITPWRTEVAKLEFLDRYYHLIK